MGCTGNSVTIFAEAVTQPLDSRSPDRPSPRDRKDSADIPAGELTLRDMESFNDQPIARGVGDPATDAIKTMWPLQCERREMAEGQPVFSYHPGSAANLIADPQSATPPSCFKSVAD
jgi:hypothetical protein